MKLLRHFVPMPFVLVLLSTMLACALSTDAPPPSDERLPPGSEPRVAYGLRATLPTDAALPMLVVSDHGLPVRTLLRPGTSTVAVPPLPQCTVQVRGLPDDVPQGRLRLVPFLMARNEPGLAELRGDGNLVYTNLAYLIDEKRPLARLRSTTDELAADTCDRVPLTHGTATTALQWRGRYAFLLQVRDDAGAWHSLYERTSEHVDITTGEQTIELTVDPEQVRGLLRPQRPANGK